MQLRGRSIGAKDMLFGEPLAECMRLLRGRFEHADHSGRDFIEQCDWIDADSYLNHYKS